MKAKIGSALRAEYPHLKLSDIAIFKKLQRDMSARAKTVANQVPTSGEQLPDDTPRDAHLDTLNKMFSSYKQLKSGTIEAVKEHECVLIQAGEYAQKISSGRMKQ